jgi:hypothetical protein
MAGADQLLLANRLREACKPVADAARLSSARWSRRVPLSVRLQGGASRIQIVAGGQRAPQAYTMEGRADGRPIAHPVYGHGPRTDWTWVKQTPRPFMREAIDAHVDEVVAKVAEVVDDWAKQLGYK